MFSGYVDGEELVFLYMFLYIFVKYIIYWMTRMTCSKDAWFVKGVWRPCTFYRARTTRAAWCAWPHYFLINVEKKAVASSEH